MTPVVYDPTAEVAELRDELRDLNIELTRARKERDAAWALISDMKLNFTPGEPLRSRIEAVLHNTLDWKHDTVVPKEPR